jgi:hypothetical protein
MDRATVQPRPRATELLVQLVVLSSSPIMAGCQDPAHPVDDWRPPTCELASRTKLADADVVAPNGQSGAQLLAAVPASSHATLQWDLSSSMGIEVEVPGSSGSGTELDLTFGFAAQPEFFFEDRIVVEHDEHGGIDHDLAVICEDYVTTSLDVSLVSADGSISLALTNLEVRLGPEDPPYEVAKPFASQTTAMATPQVNFLKPEALAASMNKNIALEFDGTSSTGAITVYAEGASETYEHLVARW